MRACPQISLLGIALDFEADLVAKIEQNRRRSWATSRIEEGPKQAKSRMRAQRFYLRTNSNTEFRLNPVLMINWAPRNTLQDFKECRTKYLEKQVKTAY